MHTLKEWKIWFNVITRFLKWEDNIKFQNITLKSLLVNSQYLNTSVRENWRKIYQDNLSNPPSSNTVYIFQKILFKILRSFV